MNMKDTQLITNSKTLKMPFLSKNRLSFQKEIISKYFIVRHFIYPFPRDGCFLDIATS